MPRVLRIINRFNLGGPTYNASYLTRYLAPEFDTLLIGGSPQPGEAHSGFIPESLGITYRELTAMSRSVNALRDWQSFTEIRQIIREFRPDIVHTHAAKAGALGRIAARSLGVPVIVHTYHGHVFDQYFSPWKSELVQRAERLLARSTDAIVTISELQKLDIVRRFRIAPEEKVHVIPLGFDLDRFAVDAEMRRKAFREKWQLSDDECAVGLIGRFAPVKNHALFIRAFAEAKKANTNIRAFLIGDGPLKSELTALIESLGLAWSDAPGRADILFTSWIKDIPEVMPGLDIVALSSLNEGTPVSLIEAQAAGKPVISTDVGGVRDCILSGESGIICGINDVSAFAEAMTTLAGDSTLRKAMGAEGKTFVFQRFHYTRLVADTRALYHSLLS
jgi:glycosyltransferase involved in cell wall biosynthesis